MTRFDNPLENVRIASPCNARWEDMYGDERMRFCGDCKLNVFNLSGMTKYDAENLFRLSEGRLCVRYYQRPDGTILTKDCPVGWARVKERVSVLAAALMTLVISVLGGLYVASSVFRKSDLRGAWPPPLLTPPPKQVPLMGAVAMPPRRDNDKDADKKSPRPAVKTLPIYSPPQI